MRKKLREMYEYYAGHALDAGFEETVKRELGIDLSAAYGPVRLKNPLLVAPGQMTTTTGQVASIRKAGYGGCVLKSVVGEDAAGSCSMLCQRKKPSYVKTVYDPDDSTGAFPVIHWDGAADLRTLTAYLPFAEKARVFQGGDFLLVASILCHLPPAGEPIQEDEWVHTTRSLFGLGYRIFEIDFCPFLAAQDRLMVQEAILRWYTEIPRLMKSVSSEITVYPKMLNLDFGLTFQVGMAEAARAGKADGIIIANRIFKKEYGCAHGGRELRERNLLQIREIRKRAPDLPVSATGGVYSGKHVHEFLSAGAENVQLLSYLMGKVGTPFPKAGGNRFEQVFHRIVFDPEDGLLAALL